MDTPMTNRYLAAVFSVLLSICSTRAAENLLLNSSFEDTHPQKPQLPAHWDAIHHASAPLAFSSEHYEGARSALLVGDGRQRMWRQKVTDTRGIKAFRLSSYVKVEDLHFARGEHAYIYAHVLYAGKPYSQATHFSWKIRPGTYDWLKVSARRATVEKHDIAHILISVTGKFSRGNIYVDGVELTEDIEQSPDALLAGKIDDLRQQLERIGEVDALVAKANKQLEAANAALRERPSNLALAKTHWAQAAEAVSHEAWEVMFPNAVADRPVEAQMIYHGIGQTKETCDRYLDVMGKAGCNGVLLSLGSWTSVIYHSDVLPVRSGWKDFDALSYVTDQAHRRGIKVFGYLACFHGTHNPERIPGNIAHDHPEWLATGPDRNMPKFPDPANPEIVDLIALAYKELATRYALDGVGLDYIRYPTPNSLNYDEHNRRQIRNRYGIDILDGKPYLDAEKWDKIRQYRAEIIGVAVRKIREAVRVVAPRTEFIASLISEPAYARASFGQDWAKWSSLLDYATPMNYDHVSANELLLANQRDLCRRNHYAFIPAIGGMPHVHQSWTISQWAKRVAIQRKIGCDGIIIYRIGDLDPAVAAFFGRGPFHGGADFPTPPRKTQDRQP